MRGKRRQSLALPRHTESRSAISAPAARPGDDSTRCEPSQRLVSGNSVYQLLPDTSQQRRRYINLDLQTLGHYWRDIELAPYFMGTCE